MARKNRNNTHQRNAEKKARKVNRLAANGRKAREVKRELLAETAKTEFCVKDRSFDARTEQMVSVAVKLGENLETTFCLCKQYEPDARLVAKAEGIALSYDNAEGCLVLRFPPDWTIDRVTKEAGSDAWGLYAYNLISNFPENVIFMSGDRFHDLVHETVDGFTEWIADCGVAPEGNIVDVDTDSTCISHVRYNVENRKMRITFQKGGTWEYDGVPRKRFTGLVSADSVGGYFWSNILDYYECRRVA